MADDFDNQLGRLFNQPPAFSDNEVFAALVTARLDRAWTMRRMIIGVGGLAAGVVVAWQFLAGRLGGELSLVSSDTRQAMDSSVNRLISGFDHVVSLPAGSETLWLGAALAVAALAMAITRAVEAY
jgi:hypothetical protein